MRTERLLLRPLAMRDLDALATLHAEGALVAEHQPEPEQFTVLLDPAGHPFCLFPVPVT